MDGCYLWDPSVIKADDTWHLFASRWPAAEKMEGWRRSEVIRATSKSLFGPWFRRNRSGRRTTRCH
jgi:hypothetical protein